MDRHTKALQILHAGTVIPATPLALDENRCFDEEGQRLLMRYYLNSEVGGIATAVHTTQFEIRLPEYNLYDRILNVVKEEIDAYEAKTGKVVVRVAGVCGKTEQAVNEAKKAKALGYENVSEIVGETVKLAVPSNLKCYTAIKRSECQTIIDVKVSGTQAPGILSMGGSRANLALWNKINEVNYEGMPAETNRSYQATADVDPDKIDDVKKALEEIGLKAMSVEDEVGMFKTFFDVILIVFNIFGGIALAAASIGIINTLFMAVQERTREIGLDKALGMSDSKVFLSFSAEAIMLGFWGSALGIAVSYLVGQAANVIAAQTFTKDFPTFKLAIFEPLTMISIALTIMFIAFLAGTLPARRASKKNPIDALRYE